MIGMLKIFNGLDGNAEVTRLIGFSAAIAYPFPYIYEVLHKGAYPEPNAFGQGYALVLGAIGIMIGAKAYGVGKQAALQAQAQGGPNV